MLLECSCSSHQAQDYRQECCTFVIWLSPAHFTTSSCTSSMVLRYTKFTTHPTYLFIYIRSILASASISKLVSQTRHARTLQTDVRERLARVRRGLRWGWHHVLQRVRAGNIHHSGICHVTCSGTCACMPCQRPKVVNGSYQPHYPWNPSTRDASRALWRRHNESTYYERHLGQPSSRKPHCRHTQRIQHHHFLRPQELERAALCLPCSRPDSNPRRTPFPCSSRRRTQVN